MLIIKDHTFWHCIRFICQLYCLYCLFACVSQNNTELGVSFLIFGELRADSLLLRPRFIIFSHFRCKKHVGTHKTAINPENRMKIHKSFCVVTSQYLIMMSCNTYEALWSLYWGFMKSYTVLIQLFSMFFPCDILLLKQSTIVHVCPIFKEPQCWTQQEYSLVNFRISCKYNEMSSVKFVWSWLDKCGFYRLTPQTFRSPLVHDTVIHKVIPLWCNFIPW